VHDLGILCGLVKVWDAQVEEGGAELWDQNFGLILVQTTDTAMWSLYGPKGMLWWPASNFKLIINPSVGTLLYPHHPAIPYIYRCR
jgi:hypothetical protein